jgi:endonuclease/exonuclease/phosphatase family metal-dependent hydrolase
MARILFFMSVVVTHVAGFSAYATAGSPATLLKVLTLNFNAEMVPPDVKSHLRDRRFKAIVDWLKVHDPDVIMLQEGWNFHGDVSVAQTIARAMKYDVTYRLTMGAPGFIYSSEAILAKKSLRMSDRRDVELPHNACHFGDGKSWTLITGPVSYAVGATLKLASGEPLYVYTSHLVGDSDGDKRDQFVAMSEAIRAQIEKDGGRFTHAKVIMGGDLNSVPASPLDLYAQNVGYRDAWEETHPFDPGYTDCADPSDPCYNPMQLAGDLFPSQSDESHSRRIDHVYTMGDELKTLASTMVFTAPLEGVWMSDHYGLLATIGVNGEMPSSIPNPARDHEGELLPTHMLELTPKMFQCDGPSIDRRCGSRLSPFYVVGPRGLTIVNVKGVGFLKVQFRGPGDVFASSHASLDNGERASFVFSKDGNYSFVARDADGNTVEGVIRAVFEPFAR